MPPLTPPLAGPPARVAVFRALQLGDMLCAVPALRALRAGWPQAHITLIGLPWTRELVARLPYADEFVDFPGFPGLPEREPDLALLPGFLADMQARRFDLVLQLHGSGVLSNPLVASFGARRCAGFSEERAWQPPEGCFLPWPQDQHEVHRLLALLKHLGVPSCGEHLELPLSAAEQEAFAALRARLPLGDGGYVCVHPGARLASRRWLPERFAEVADRLAAEGLDIVLTGCAAEAPLVQAIRARMRAPAIDLAGRTTLGTLAALIGGARLLVCNDTGVSHVAAAMGTTSVVVCCGSDPRRWHPLDRERHRTVWFPVPCRPCPHTHCPTGHECALGVETGMVLAQALQLLHKPQETLHA